jgi:hypothetical protein
MANPMYPNNHLWITLGFGIWSAFGSFSRPLRDAEQIFFVEPKSIETF